MARSARRRIKAIRKKGRSRLRSQINFLAYFRQFSINEFLLKDRCALPDQMSSVFTFSRRRFILAMRDGDGANKNKIAVFDFGVTPKHFPQDTLRTHPRSPRPALGAVPIYRPVAHACHAIGAGCGWLRRLANAPRSTRLPNARLGGLCPTKRPCADAGYPRSLERLVAT